ncbi:MAG: 16S rRNA (guanine(966)-N(2))-methyltransferase RsmD [Gallionella sp.]
MRQRISRRQRLQARSINKIRIGGGELRRRVIRFPSSDGLRPTPDRVRETLFNWLGQTLDGRCCLDLFSGSGALGFEAVSRGAAPVWMVEKNLTVFRALKDNASRLGCDKLILRHQDGRDFLCHNTEQYDVIFLDPPFQCDYLPRLLEMLPKFLLENGVVYVESAAEIEVSPPWQVLKSRRAGQVYFQLIGLNPF